MVDATKKQTVLAVSAEEEDHAALRAILSASEWDLRSAGSGRQAWMILHETGVDVVLTECDFPDGLRWTALLDEILAMGGSQPVIVTSRLAGDSLWAEVLNLGGYGLLVKPFDPTEVLRVVSLASGFSSRAYWPGGSPRRSSAAGGARLEHAAKT